MKMKTEISNRKKFSVVYGVVLLRLRFFPFFVPHFCSSYQADMKVNKILFLGKILFFNNTRLRFFLPLLLYTIGIILVQNGAITSCGAYMALAFVLGMVKLHISFSLFIFFASNRDTS